MQTIPINKNNAITAFKNADDNGRKLLTDLLGKENVSGNIMDMIKTFEDAQALDTGWTQEDEAYLQNVKKAVIITRVLNEGWKPDYSDNKQPKWYVWMVYDKASGSFRFTLTVDDYTIAFHGAGSRHVFKSAELAKYFESQFNTLINQIIL